MVLASVQESEGVSFPLWETAPYGVVSLLAMLEFAARPYVEISYQFGLMLGNIGKQNPHAERFGDALSKLLSDASGLGLVVTCEHLGRMAIELIEANPGKMAFEGGKVTFKDISADPQRLCHYIEAVYATMKAELGAVLLKAIPRERTTYNNSEWLKDSPVESKFPTSFKELVRGGVCYSLGQSTGSVFHAMRALEPALSALAQPFNISTAHENWQNIIEQIESAVRGIGQQVKSQQKL